MNAASRTVFGIDLGTTNSCVSYYQDGSFKIIDIDGQATVPSVVACRDGEWLVGRRAVNHAVQYPTQAVRSIKRHMGESHYSVSLGGQAYSPSEISAKILQYLKAQVEETTGGHMHEVVITVPAWFNDPQRRATLAAGEAAGFKVLRVINEPTAAALAYGLTDATPLANRPHETWMVYDLGGGTFDVSIVSSTGSYKEVLASCGNTFLGGDDFDSRLLQSLIDKTKDRHGMDISQNAVAVAQLRQATEHCKIQLSTVPEARIEEYITIDGRSLAVEHVVSRDQFNGMIEELIDSTIQKAKQALEQAGKESSDLSRLLLVGGSTRIPYVRTRVAEAFGLEPDLHVDPDISVALGAGIQAALDKQLSFDQIVVDVSPHTLGVAALGEVDIAAGFGPANPHFESEHPLTFAPIIKRNARLPAKFVEEFFTSRDNQEAIDVVVYQGESRNTRDNAYIGEFRVNIPPMSAGSSVFIGFEYDNSGIVKVSVSDKGHGAALKTHALDLNHPSARRPTSGMSPLPEVDADFDFDVPETPVAPKVSNYLIERVEARLQKDGEPTESVRNLLEEYRALLQSGDNRQLDALEDRLYQWLDTPASPTGDGSAHAAKGAGAHEANP